VQRFRTVDEDNK